jgi:hypothetical protein
MAGLGPGAGGVRCGGLGVWMVERWVVWVGRGWLVVCGCGVCTYGCVLAKLRVSKVAVCCFSWGICYDFYAVKTAAGG